MVCNGVVINIIIVIILIGDKIKFIVVEEMSFCDDFEVIFVVCEK